MHLTENETQSAKTASLFGSSMHKWTRMATD